MMRAPALALLLSACTAPPTPASDPMAAFAPLMGCWRGEFAGQPEIHDERCFEPLGEHIVDRHYVRPTTYWGETTYHYDDAQNEIVFAYASGDGGRSNGVALPEAGGIVFPAHTHRGADGREQRLRSVWTFVDADHFSVVSEREDNGAWVSFGRIEYTRAADSE